MKRTQPMHLPPRSVRTLQRGVSIIELMISITLGMLIMVALLALTLNLTRTNNEMAKANRQIENGRFAIQLLQNDIIHAGFWGRLGYTMAPAFSAPTDIPDPCMVSGWDAAYKNNLLSIPVQGFANGSTLAGCNVSGVRASSDVLVVRHANTCTFGTLGCDGGDDKGPHIQVSACRTAVPPEAAYAIDSAVFPLMEKNCATIAPLRKIVSNIYYLANSDSDSCRPATATCPTLMRASLVNGAYPEKGQFGHQPLIEGIEAFRVEYGIDNLGRNGLPISATNLGDGSADEYVTSAELQDNTNPTVKLARHANIVAVKIHVLARNLETSLGYTDTKTYTLGSTTLGPFTGEQAKYKRHVFSTTVRLVNPSGRREIPL